MHSGFFASDEKIGLAGGDLYAEGPTQQTKMAVCRTEQLKLSVRI